MEKPGGLQSTGLQRVRHDPMTSLSLSFTLGNNRSNGKGVGYLALLGALKYFNNRLGGVVLPTRWQGPGCRS